MGSQGAGWARREPAATGAALRERTATREAVRGAGCRGRPPGLGAPGPGLTRPEIRELGLFRCGISVAGRLGGSSNACLPRTLRSCRNFWSPGALLSSEHKARGPVRRSGSRGWPGLPALFSESRLPGCPTGGTGARAAGSAPAWRSVRPAGSPRGQGRGCKPVPPGDAAGGGKPPPRPRRLVGAGGNQGPAGGRDCGALCPQGFRAALPGPAARGDVGSRKVSATSGDALPWRRAGGGAGRCGAVRCVPAARHRRLGLPAAARADVPVPRGRG